MKCFFLSIYFTLFACHESHGRPLLLSSFFNCIDTVIKPMKVYTKDDVSVLRQELTWNVTDAKYFGIDLPTSNFLRTKIVDPWIAKPNRMGVYTEMMVNSLIEKLTYLRDHPVKMNLVVPYYTVTSTVQDAINTVIWWRQVY